jgi:lysophospholipase L1-like esterase
MADRMRAGNELIRQFIATRDNATFVNVWDLMLNKKGKPDPGIFIDDMLHMNPKGYKIWKKKIEPELVK